jgi:hypothetical protein
LIASLWLAASSASAQAPAQPSRDAAPPAEPSPLVIREHSDAPRAAPAPAPAPARPAPAVRKPAATKPSKSKTGGDEDPDATAKTERRRAIRITLVSGYGLDLDPSVTGVNPFGVSFGVRGGYTLGGSVYLGTRFLFFVGEARVMPDDTEQSADEWLLGFEGGYGFRFGPLVLRPELGLGLAISSSEASRAGAADTDVPVPIDTSSEDPYFELGVVLEVDLSRRLVFGVEARSALVLGKETASSDAELFALVLLGTVGFRF